MLGFPKVKQQALSYTHSINHRRPIKKRGHVRPAYVNIGIRSQRVLFLLLLLPPLPYSNPRSPPVSTVTERPTSPEWLVVKLTVGSTGANWSSWKRERGRDSDPDHTKVSVRFQPWSCWGLRSELDVSPPLFTLLQSEMPTDGVWAGWCDQPLKLHACRSLELCRGRPHSCQTRARAK